MTVKNRLQKSNVGQKSLKETGNKDDRKTISGVHNKEHKVTLKSTSAHKKGKQTASLPHHEVLQNKVMETSESTILKQADSMMKSLYSLLNSLPSIIAKELDNGIPGPLIDYEIKNKYRENYTKIAPVEFKLSDEESIQVRGNTEHAANALKKHTHLVTQHIKNFKNESKKIIDKLKKIAQRVKLNPELRHMIHALEQGDYAIFYDDFYDEFHPLNKTRFYKEEESQAQLLRNIHMEFKGESKYLKSKNMNLEGTNSLAKIKNILKGRLSFATKVPDMVERISDSMLEELANSSLASDRILKNKIDKIKSGNYSITLNDNPYNSIIQFKNTSSGEEESISISSFLEQLDALDKRD